MKLHILSDVHLEFGKWPKDVDINAIEADVTILAGDIGEGLEGIEWALSIDRPVIYVMGNHEYYGQRPMTDLWRMARERVEHTHVHLLENESIQVGAVRFLGCTLWTDFAILGCDQQEHCMECARRSLSDYHSIHARSGLHGQHVCDRITPRKILSLHHESRDYLERELARFPRNVGERDEWDKTVVVTHHAPSGLSLADQASGGFHDASYASNLESLVEKADLWIHGHTHIAIDYRIVSGRVVTNPRGYVDHMCVREFNPTKVIEI